MFTAPLPTDGIDALLDELSGLLERLEASEMSGQSGQPADAHPGSLRDSETLSPIISADVAAATLDRLRRAEALFREIGDRRGMAVAAARSGAIYATTGACAEALLCYAKGLALFVGVGDLHQAQHCTTNITRIQHYLAEQRRALAALTAQLIEISR